MRNSAVVLSNIKVQLETSISFLHDAKIFVTGANSKEIERNKILYCVRCETMQLKYSKPGKSVLLVYSLVRNFFFFLHFLWVLIVGAVGFNC